MEEYFRFNGIKRQPLQLLNHTGLSKSETTSRRDEKSRIDEHKANLKKLEEAGINNIAKEIDKILIFS